MSKQLTIQKIIALQQQFDKVMVQHRFQNWMNMELTTMQFKCLFYIVQTGIATSGKLSAALGVTPADITGVIDRLISQGFVQRQENPDDRRVIFLRPTDKGQQIIEKLNRDHAEHFTRLLDDLSEDELEQVYLGLSAVIRLVNQRMQNQVNPLQKQG